MRNGSVLLGCNPFILCMMFYTIYTTTVSAPLIQTSSLSIYTIDTNHVSHGIMVVLTVSHYSRHIAKVPINCMGKMELLNMDHACLYEMDEIQKWIQRVIHRKPVVGSSPEPPQCLWTGLQVRGSKSLGCHADLYTVSRCHTGGNLRITQVRKHPSEGSTLALKPRADITRKSKTGVSVAPRKGLMSSKKNFFKKISIGFSIRNPASAKGSPDKEPFSVRNQSTWKQYSTVATAACIRRLGLHQCCRGFTGCLPVFISRCSVL